MTEVLDTSAQNIPKVSTGSTQIQHISGTKIVQILRYGMGHQEKITYLEKLGLEKVIDANNSLYTEIMGRDKIGLYRNDADIEQAIYSIVSKNNRVVFVQQNKIPYLDGIGWRKINFLGISSSQITQY